jgi:hypothetical protein
VRFTVLRLVRAATALVAIAAIVAQAQTLAAADALNLVNFLSYFTIQSNLIGIAALGILAIRPPGPRPVWLEWLRGAATVFLTVTFVVVILLLQNVDVGLQLAWVDFVLHKLTPVVIVADWLLDPPSVRITPRLALSWLVYPLLWLAYTMVRGPMAAWYPYPFLDPANGGYGSVALTVVVILIASAVVCLAFAWVANRLGERGSPGSPGAAGSPA